MQYYCHLLSELPASRVPNILRSSVSSKSFVCRSYENCRGVPCFFPNWNDPPLRFPYARSLGPISATNSFISLAYNQIRTLLRDGAIPTFFLSITSALFPIQGRRVRPCSINPPR